jgi:hypothetical protein
MHRTLRSNRLRPVIEGLEERIALSITIQFDYSHDTSGFFSANPVTQTLLAEAGQALGSQLDNQLAAITPGAGPENTWTLSPPFVADIVNPSLPANTILVEVVGTALGPSAFAGEGGPSGFSARGAPAWLNNITTRGGNSSNMSLLGGGIEFNTTEGWFTQTSGGQEVFNQSFFYGVALHELGHVLGLGTSALWTSFVNKANNTFTGPHAEASFGSPVPLDTSATDAAIDAHWAETDLSDGQPPVMIPIYHGAQAFTPLDWAGLSDVGWSVNQLAVNSEPPPSLTGGEPGNGSPNLPIFPTIVGEQILTAGKGRHKHLTGFELMFSEPLAISRATDVANYSITQKIKHGRKTVNQPVKFSVGYTAGSSVVDVLVAGKPAFLNGGQLVVNAHPPGGVSDTAGDLLAGNTSLIILPKARDVVG